MITVGNFNYTISKIDARRQFHIVRRLTPFLDGLVQIKATGAKDIEAAGLAALPAMATVLSKMDDETADYVLFGLLSCIKREQPNGTGYANICAGTMLAYDDISMAHMLQLAAAALKENLSDFFVILKSTFKELTPTE